MTDNRPPTHDEIVETYRSFGVRPPGEPTTRAEHLAWCKQRALEYIDAGDPQNAFASMVSDLGKHPETAGHPGLELGAMLLMAGHLSTTQQVREFIEGFN